MVIEATSTAIPTPIPTLIPIHIRIPIRIPIANGSRAIVCDSEIGIPKSPCRIQFNSPRELAVVRPPQGFYAEIGGCSAPPPPRINDQRGWSVSALVAQKLNGAFNWS